jgi:3-dehydroquinate synthase II
MAKLLWVSADGTDSWGKRKERVTSALEAGADAVVVNPGEAGRVKELGSIKVVAKDGDIKAQFFTIKNKEDEQRAAKATSSGFVVVSTTDWKVIPLENLIAEAHRKDGRLIARVGSVSDAKLALETLELGVDGVLFGGKASDIPKVKGLMERMSTVGVKLQVAKVTNIKPVGMGDRVCVDTCSLFEKGEGMLVGSQSSGLFLVHSETIESPYVAARPFRVNAGPVHAYTLLPNGKTQYLSELKSGDEVLAVDAKGNTRVLVIGRMKIEKRPLLLVEARVGGKTMSTILQNAETIRLVDKNGRALSVSSLKKGDEVLVHAEEGGRHFGIAVKETIEEK